MSFWRLARDGGGWIADLLIELTSGVRCLLGVMAAWLFCRVIWLLLDATASTFTSWLTGDALNGDLNGLDRPELLLSRRLLLKGWDGMDMDMGGMARLSDS